MNKKFFNKKIVFIVLALFFATCFTVSRLIISEGKKSKVVEVSILSDSVFKPGSYSIKSIRIGETNHPLSNFDNGKDFLVGEDGLLHIDDSMSKAVLKLKLSVIDDLIITFDKNDLSQGVVVREKSQYKDISTIMRLSDNDEVSIYYSQNRVTNILKTAIQGLSVIDSAIYILTFILSAVIFYFCCKYFWQLIEKIAQNKIAFFDILKAFIALSIIFLSCIFILLELLNIFIIIPIIGLFFVVGLKLKNSIKQHIEYLFLAFGIILGISMLTLLPPFHVPDESTHFIKAYRMSYTLQSGLRVVNPNTFKAGLYVPVEMIDTIHRYDVDIHSGNYTLSAKNFFIDFGEKISQEGSDTSYISFGNTEKLNPFCYIPASIMIFLARILNTSVLTSLFMARLINLFIFVICGFYALRLAPKFKNTLFLVMTLPITIQQVMAVNQDTITYSLIFLMFGYILNLAYGNKKRLAINDILPLSIMGVLLSFCKFVYFPILFLSFLIPLSKFSSKKERYKSLLLVIIPNIIFTFLSVVLSSGNMALGDYYTFSDIIHNPLKMFNIFVDTFVWRAPLDYLKGLVDGFGWFTKWHSVLNSFIVSSIFLIFFLTANSKEAADGINTRFRITTFLTFGAIFGIVYVSLLTIWTKVGANVIDGLQSRYFIPSLLPLLMTISNTKISINFENKSFAYLIGISIVFGICFYTILSGFYI